MSQQNYPEKTCEIERLVTHPKLVEAALAGTKTQQRRNGIYGYPGEEFELEGTKFVITDLNHVRLGDMSEEDARAEGFPNIAFYRDVIIKMHAGMEWDEDHLVWLHEFKIVA
jgi:hypothetical protein